MEMIADTRLLGSLDVVELNPALDVRNEIALLSVSLLESLFGKSTLVRRRVSRPALDVLRAPPGEGPAGIARTGLSAAAPPSGGSGAS